MPTKSTSETEDTARDYKCGVCWKYTTACTCSFNDIDTQPKHYKEYDTCLRCGEEFKRRNPADNTERICRRRCKANGSIEDKRPLDFISTHDRAMINKNLAKLDKAHNFEPGSGWAFPGGGPRKMRRSKKDNADYQAGIPDEAVVDSDSELKQEIETIKKNGS